MFDILIIGAGPAALIMASALAHHGLSLQGLAPTAPDTPWPNTYGVWCDELADLGLSHLLGHRWQNTVSYFGQAAATPSTHHRRDYGLFDKHKLQQHFLDQLQSMTWHRGKAAAVTHGEDHSWVTTAAGEELQAKLIIDTTGHHAALVQRPPATHAPVAYQVAYGIVGKFSKPPVAPGQCSLMDYRAEHLTSKQLGGPPTFLYAMDLGEDVFFVEETSLALAPAMAYDTLQERLQQRLKADGVEVREVHHTEHCLFPMNQPLPDLNQRVLGFGGSASMVHPATGYMVGAMLRRAPEVADAIATALGQGKVGTAVAAAGWHTLWTTERLRKHHIYQFGLETLMRFSHKELCQFFDSFFRLPQTKWSGFLADTLTPFELVMAMVTMFSQTTNPVRGGLMGGVGTDGQLLLKSLIGTP
ncbi:lycopene beta cyclase [Leptothoe sp. PORK10 BA2]|uniref:lycopene beta cyclase n=1 Tax=Leptothoe sp. PORK10 BA2 TaxID=3110254 RepID=UPI002B1EE500|nr:lycopene cyclase family protein [Leptothoe sp. PORK10 BA2]MEA5462612.1 lycopene cyclase family protein [Leptothoe sp. PORK10 BA2]